MYVLPLLANYMCLHIFAEKINVKKLEMETENEGKKWMFYFNWI